jgi:parallel beta-helix repeat protein
MLPLYAKSGSGLPGDPYVIENLLIDMDDQNSNAGIWIKYTNANVVIRNCKIINGNTALNNKHNPSSANNLGIQLENVRNLIIENCQIETNNMGMWLEGCLNVSVFDCIVKNNVYRGIYLLDSKYCVIANNDVEDNTGDDILLNTNFLKISTKCQFNRVTNNTTEKIHLMGNLNTSSNVVKSNVGIVSVDSGVGPNTIE